MKLDRHMTTYKTIISPKDLCAYIQSPDNKNFIVLDCSFDLVNIEAGLRAYESAHIEGSYYINLETQLSSTKTGLNGRHPLPSRENFLQILENLGIDEKTQIFIYDNAGGMYAARLWWMCRWVGHDLAAVLDGGIQRWQLEEFPLVTSESPKRAVSKLSMRDAKVNLISYDQVLENLQNGLNLVLDARASDRFRGENETLDPIGGHIPNAKNHFFKNNLTDSGIFKSPSELKSAFEEIIGERSIEKIICQCGSGVTACHNLLAMEIAGLSGAGLYAGSWSEWCAQPNAPVATGEAI